MEILALPLWKAIRDNNNLSISSLLNNAYVKWFVCSYAHIHSAIFGCFGAQNVCAFGAGSSDVATNCPIQDVAIIDK